MKSFRRGVEAPNRRRSAGYWTGVAFSQAVRSFNGGLAALAGLSDTGDRRLERGAKAVDDRVDLAPVDDKGRRQQDMVAVHPINRAAHWIDHQTQRHRLALDARIEFRRGIERLFAGAVADQFERPKEAASANVADKRVLAEAFLEAALQPRAHLDYVGEQVIPADDILHRERRRRGHRVAHVGVAVLKGA